MFKRIAIILLFVITPFAHAVELIGKELHLLITHDDEAVSCVFTTHSTESYHKDDWVRETYNGVCVTPEQIADMVADIEFKEFDGTATQFAMVSPIDLPWTEDTCVVKGQINQNPDKSNITYYDKGLFKRKPETVPFDLVDITYQCGEDDEVTLGNKPGKLLVKFELESN